MGIALWPLVLCWVTSAAQESGQEGKSASLADWKSEWRSAKEPDKRKELLRSSAAFAVDGDAKSIKDCAKFLVQALEDENYSVRNEAVRLLLLSSAKSTAVESLASGLEALRMETAKLGRGALGGRGGGGDDGTEENEEGAEEAARRAKLRESAEQRVEYGQALIDGLASLPDDRSVEALSSFLERADRQVTERFGTPMIRALLKLGSRDAVGKVVDSLPLLSDPAARAGNAPQGGGGRGGRASDGKELHESLKRFAIEKNLGEAPEWGVDGPDHWAQWFARHRKDLPAKLGKLSDPK